MSWEKWKTKAASMSFSALEVLGLAALLAIVRRGGDAGMIARSAALRDLPRKLAVMRATLERQSNGEAFATTEAPIDKRVSDGLALRMRRVELSITLRDAAAAAELSTVRLGEIERGAMAPATEEELSAIDAMLKRIGENGQREYHLTEEQTKVLDELLETTKPSDFFTGMTLEVDGKKIPLEEALSILPDERSS